MVRITIIGWYGTETIGDRAILAGIISFLCDALGNDFEVNLGSLYPFFSERTLKEDQNFYKKITGKEIKIKIFNSKIVKELNSAINASDVIMMGGGPLMHIDDMYLIEYAFKKSRKLGKKTILFGCGVGPFFTIRHKKLVIDIINHTDIVILRDSVAKNNLREIYSEFDKVFPDENIKVSLDPAVKCAYEYNNLSKNLPFPDCEYIAVNLREFPKEYSNEKDLKEVDVFLADFLEKIASNFHDKKIKLIPMHYFHVGGDDRIFLNKLKFNAQANNIEVQNSNLSLEDTMDVFRTARLNFGMRFHSVVLQSIVSGKNYVLDYTEPGKGKISGFLKDIDKYNFYDKRNIQLQELNRENHPLATGWDLDNKFEVRSDILKKYFDIYNISIKEIIK